MIRTNNQPGGPRVVIIGAGFGGLMAARGLARTDFRVTVIDRNNYHTFLPLLYQVATAEVEPEEIVYPVRSILRPFPNVDFLLAEVEKVNFAAREVDTNIGPIAYDYLILSLGSATHYFGIPGASEHSFPLKTLDDAVRLRNHILCCFERVAHLSPQERRRRLTFTIVGGGPTGVEFAGALAELLRGPLRRDHPEVDFQEVRIVLVETREALLGMLPQTLGSYAFKRLQAMGVEVHLHTAVTQVTPQEVHLKDGTVVPTETVVWTAGVRGDPSAGEWGLSVDRTHRIPVLPTLEVPNFPRVFAIGDIAHPQNSGPPLPLIAPVAMQQATTAARNIRKQEAGEQLKPFHYHDRGMMAAIGRNAGVAFFAGKSFTGFPAWLMWLGVHLLKLVGFRNRMAVMMDWAWDYFLFERTVRLIVPTGSCRGR